MPEHSSANSLASFRSCCCLLLGLGLSLIASPAQAQNEADAWVGKLVMPKMDCKLMEEGKVIQDSKVNRVPYRVLQTQDQWLLVGDRQPGWVLEQDIVPLNQAVKYYTDVLSKSPKSTLAYIRRAISAQELRQPNQAVADYTEALKLEPKNALALNNRGSAYSQLGQSQKAMDDFAAALAIDANYVLVYINRGSLHYGLHEYDAAAADLAKALELDPNSWLAHYNNAAVLEAQGKIKDAINEYEQAIKFNSRDPLAYNNLAWILSTSSVDERRDGKRGVELALKACELTKWKDPESADTLAAAYAEAGNWPRAVEVQDYAVKIATGERAGALKSRLELYKQQRPFRAE